MIRKDFPKQELLDIGLPYDPPDGGEIIKDEIIDHRRWVVTHELIFRFPGQPENEAWQTFYSVGATEYQEESPWEHDDIVTGTLVHQIEKTIKVWVVKNV